MTTQLVGEFKCQVGVSRSTRWIMWHKCIHMRVGSRGGEEEPPPRPAAGSALWECKPRRWTLPICVYCHRWPIGKCFLIESRGASNASLEQERKSRLPDVSVIFYFLQSFIETTGCDIGLLTKSETKVVMFKMWMVSEGLQQWVRGTNTC